MFKSVIVASLLLASQVFAEVKKGDVCSTFDIEITGQQCDQEDPTKMLRCVIAESSSEGVWEYNQNCAHCCVVPALGTICVDSKEQCLQMTS